MTHIKTEAQYEAIMKRIDELFFETDENTPADDPRLVELDMLSALANEYEKEVYPIKPPTLTEMITYRMHEMKLTQRELSEMLEITPSRLSQIMTGKKLPTYRQAQILATKLDIDARIVLSL